MGFSDHSMGHIADVVAASLGARVIEKHFCLDRGIKTADSAFSMEPSEFRAMVDAVRTAVSAVGKPSYAPSEVEAANLAFRRSVFACADIEKGEAFSADNIRIVRPGYGARPKHYDELLGKAADRPYSFGEPIVYEG